MSLPCAICSFCTRTGESHSTGFISPDASLNTAGVFVYKPKGKTMMSDITISRLEVVNGHTEWRCVMAVLTISIDLTKNEFQIHGLGRNRKI